ncbi:hypothetical protein LTR43_012459, partial [Exophiala xenobiotica]
MKTKPTLVPFPGDFTSLALSDVDRKLLQHWFEKTCQIMVVDQEVNPWSYAIVPYLSLTKSLVCALQSVSAGHKQFFHMEHMETVLQKRGQATVHFQDELGQGQQPLHHSFLTVYILGVSSSYIATNRNDIGEDMIQEAMFELQLFGDFAFEKATKDWAASGEAFCKNGLIMLYRLCGRIDNNSASEEECLAFVAETEDIIRQHALTVLELVLGVPTSSTAVIMQDILLVSAGAELTRDDIGLR